MEKDNYNDDRVKSVAILLTMLVVGVLWYFGQVQSLQYRKEYVAGTGNIQGSVDVEWFAERGSEFEIGANTYGYAVFKQPDLALQKLQQEDAAGIVLIQREYDLPPLTQNSYDVYGVYGWQVMTGTEEEQEKADFVSSFVDIYENSDLQVPWDL